MQGSHEHLLEELRKAEQARDLLMGLERRLRKKEDRAELERDLVQLERLEGSFAEGHIVRLLIESAVGSARARGASRAGSDVSRSRSAIEGRVSSLQGAIRRGDGIGSMDA